MNKDVTKITLCFGIVFSIYRLVIVVSKPLKCMSMNLGYTIFLLISWYMLLLSLELSYAEDILIQRSIFDF